MFFEPQQSGDKGILQAQFNEKPYPDFALDEPIKSSDFNELFKHSYFPACVKAFHSVSTVDTIRILDVGCGSGHKLSYLAKANPNALITAVDFSSESLEIAAQRMKFRRVDNVDFHCVSLEDIPLIGKFFDFINCDEVLYLSDDVLASLSTLKGILNPRGIIRANLHNYYSRFYNNCSQELFKVLGLKSEPPGDFRRDFVRIFMSGLSDASVLKQKTWSKDKEITDQIIEMNNIFFGDKGFTFPQLFSFLDNSGLFFIDLVNSSEWDLDLLFPESGRIDILSDLLAELDYRDKLHLFELLSNSHRLMDFWCCRTEDISSSNTSDLANSTVVLNPLLNTPLVKKDLVISSQNFLPFEASKYISSCSAFPLFVDSSQSFLLLPLFDGPVKFTDLVFSFMKQPCINASGVRVDSMSYEQSFSFVSELIDSLKSCFFVFVLD